MDNGFSGWVELVVAFNLSFIVGEEKGMKLDGMVLNKVLFKRGC